MQAGEPQTCVLPLESKILARIVAARLQPLVQDAMRLVPQFAYLAGRQVADATDRVLSHCARVRAGNQHQSRSVFRLAQGSGRVKLQGGIQLSLDLAKAYDRMPRARLVEALRRVGAPSDLLSLVLYIHDHSRVVISKHDRECKIGLGRGVRQGCGLSPLLWLCYTLLLHDELEKVLPLESQTSYADDFHVMWEPQDSRSFRAACQQIHAIMRVFHELGMQVSVSKTVVLMSICGSDAERLLRTFTCRRKGERFLRITLPDGILELPLRRSHDYLGIKIGYHHFERETVRHRIRLSWTAFHRVHLLLKHPLVPLRKRVLLWLSHVWAVAKHGIASCGLDAISMQKLQSVAFRQLRMVARSPAHLTHEPNHELLKRLNLVHPIDALHQQCQQRIDNCRESVALLQPQRVHQWWATVLCSLQRQEVPDSAPAQLTEVTQVLRIQCHCSECGQAFPSSHALKVHIGKKHPGLQRRHESNPTIKNRRKDEYRRHALDGLPQCRHCRKKFYGWPQFMGHFSQEACPILHKPRTQPDAKSAHSLAPAPVVQQSPPAVAPVEPPVASTPADPARVIMEEGVETIGPGDLEALASPTPLFYRPALQQLARQNRLGDLAQAIRDSNSLQHCPECWQWVTGPSYLSRHALKCHANMQKAQQRVQTWAQKRGRLQKPCEWCLSGYSRVGTHLRTCPVLWICGHFLDRHSSLADSGQRTLQDVGGRPVPGVHEGIRPVPVLRGIDQERGHNSLLPTEMDLDRDRRRSHETEAPPPRRDAQQVCEERGQGGATGGGGLARQGQGSGAASRATGQEPNGLGTAGPQLLEPRVGRATLQSMARPSRRRQARSGPGPQSRVQRTPRAQGGGENDGPDASSGRRPALHPGPRPRLCTVSSDAGQRERVLVDKLYAAAKEWKDKKEADPSSLTQPLRNLLLFCLFAALKAQLQRMETEVDLVEKAQKMGLVENQTYLFLQWDGKQRKHVKAAQPPLEHKEAVEMLGTLEQLTASANVVGRFDANRKLTSQMSSDIVPFSLSIQNRTQESHSMFRLLHRLSRNSMWHLVGATLRPSKLGRGPAAQALDKILMYL